MRHEKEKFPGYRESVGGEHADEHLEKTDIATTRKDNKPENPDAQTQAPKQEAVRAKASETEEVAPARQEVGSEVEEPARVEATA